MGDLFGIVFNQVALMCMLMFAGGIAYWRHWIDDAGVKQISNLLLYIVNPMTIISAYQTEFSWDKLYILGEILIVSMIVLVLTFVFVGLFFKKYDAIERYGIGFANSGFIGIPLVKAVLGNEAVFHLSAFLVAMNIIIWTYGIYMITGDKKYMTLKKAIFNPGTIGTLLGLLLFISPVKLSPVLYNGVTALGNINTPLAMIILGGYIVKSNVSTMIVSKRLYLLSFFRLIVLPLLTLLVLVLLPIDDYTILMTIFIASSGPAAVNTMIFSIQFGGNSELGARFVSMSSILSMITLPLILSLGNMVFL